MFGPVFALVLCVFVLVPSSVWADDPARTPAAIAESEFVAVEVDLAEIEHEAGVDAARGAMDQANHALRVAREASTLGDHTRAARALGIARAAVILAQRQAAEARSLAALASATRVRADAEARNVAARAALAAANAERVRLTAGEVP